MILELVQQNPKTSIIVLAGLVSLFISLVNYFVLDKEKVRAGKQRQKELQQKLKDHKDNPAKAMEVQKEMVSHMMETMKHSLKPMAFTIVPALLVFWWIRNAFAGTPIENSWIWYYIISALIFSLIFRRLFKLP